MTKFYQATILFTVESDTEVIKATLEDVKEAAINCLALDLNTEESEHLVTDDDSITAVSVLWDSLKEVNPGRVTR